VWERQTELFLTPMLRLWEFPKPTNDELVGGDGGTDTELMRLLPGWIAKGGAEGLMCAASPDGLGIALKVADGNARALRPALAAFVSQLGYDLSAFAEVPLRNARGEPVGAVSNL